MEDMTCQLQIQEVVLLTLEDNSSTYCCILLVALGRVPTEEPLDVIDIALGLGSMDSRHPVNHILGGRIP
jgi:hypothetical protein